MAIVDITDVSSRDVSEQRLWGCNIEFPASGTRIEGSSITLVGWVLGRRSSAIAVEVVSDGTLVSRVPVHVHRPDIAIAFPDIPGAEQSGFQTTSSLSEAEPEFELFVHAVFQDDSRIELGAIRGRHDSLRTQVEEVATVPIDQLETRLWGCNIDLPVSDSQAEEYAITVGGWALGRSSAVVAVELIHKETLFRRIPINVRRQDIATAFPAVSGAADSGFRTTVNILGLARQFELSVRVVLLDESQILIGVIRARRRSLRSTFQPRLQPLMVTTYGRTGSNWLMRLLQQHPQILAYRPFEYEPRVGSYWMHILKTLSEPTSYLQALATKLSDEYWWLGHESSPSELVTPDPQVQQWIGRKSIESTATFCQSKIEEFYDQVAIVQSQTGAIYFAEKYSPAKFFEFTHMIMQELYPQSREIILVRDFRDMVCSILAYNEQKGTVSFGREGVGNDEEFLKRVRLGALDLLRNYESRSSQAHLLRYEDLISRPVETLSALLHYLSLESKPSTVEGMIQRASEETPGMQTHRTSPNSEKSIGRWRRDLDPSLQAVCQEAFGDILEEFGYEK